MGEHIISKYYAMANKAIITHSNEFTDKAVRLHFGPRSDRDALLYFNKWPHKRIITNEAAIKIGWLDHCHIQAELNSHNSNFFDIEVVHDLTPNLQCLGRNCKCTSLPVSMDS